MSDRAKCLERMSRQPDRGTQPEASIEAADDATKAAAT
jgi:hypothetical protein